MTNQTKTDKKDSDSSVRRGLIGGLCVIVISVGSFLIWQKMSNEEASRTALESDNKPPLIDATLPAGSEIKPVADNTAELVIEEDDYKGPLTELVPTEAQSRLLYEAEEAAIATCMNERGFEYKPNPYLSNEELEPWAEAVEPGDVVAAQTRGYGIRESIEADRVPLPVSPNEELTASLSPEQYQAWSEAFSGALPDSSYTADEGSWVSVDVPSVGKVVWDTESCVSNARRAVYGSDVKQMEDQVKEKVLREDIAAATEQDPEYNKALEHWRRCISRQGLSYEFPGQAAVALRQEFDEGKLDISALQSKEEEVAAVDATCYQQHAVDKAFAAAQQRSETKLRAKNREQIESLRSALQSALARAEELSPASISAVAD